MISFPEKPSAVAHVSDALWEIALVASANNQGRQCDDYEILWGSYVVADHIDHARCLILLGEVVEPVDPIEAAMHGLCLDYVNNSFPGPPTQQLLAACRKHFSGLTFPVQS